jgi:hypothetical protein
MPSSCTRRLWLIAVILYKATIDSPLPPPQQQQQNMHGERKGIDFPVALTSGTQAAVESLKLENLGKVTDDSATMSQGASSTGPWADASTLGGVAASSAGRRGPIQERKGKGKGFPEEGEEDDDGAAVIIDDEINGIPSHQFRISPLAPPAWPSPPAMPPPTDDDGAHVRFESALYSQLAGGPASAWEKTTFSSSFSGVVPMSWGQLPSIGEWADERQSDEQVNPINGLPLVGFDTFAARRRRDEALDAKEAAPETDEPSFGTSQVSGGRY